MLPSFQTILLLLSLIPKTLAGNAKPLSKDCTTNQGGTWKTNIPPIPLFPRQEHITIFIPPSSISIIGGIIPTTGPNNTIITTDLIQTLRLDTTHPHSGSGSGSWLKNETLTLPIPLNHLNAAFVDGRLYILSGLEVAGDGSWRGTERSWVLDLQLHGKGKGKGRKIARWRELPRLPSGLVPRGSAAVGVGNDGRIYLAGGMSILQPWQGGLQESVASVLVFDTKLEKWVVEKVPELPAPRDHAGVAVVQEVMYVLGGRDHGQINVRDTVFALDISNPKAARKGWVVKGGKMPTARGGLAAANVGGRIYTFGGEGNLDVGSNGVFNQTEVYDVRTDTWERLGPMRLPRHGTYAVAVDGRIYIPGGGVQIGPAPVDYVDVFEPCVGGK